MTDAQKMAMRAAFDADIDTAIMTALQNVTTMFGAREKANDVVTHMTNDAWRTDLIERMAAAADSVA